MHAIIKSSSIICLSLITSGLGMNYARADFVLQEDFSGASVWNSPTPTFADEGSILSSETIDTARQLSQKLEKAYVSCDESIDCEQLALVIEETNNFLNRLNREQREQFQRGRRLRIW